MLERIGIMRFEELLECLAEAPPEPWRGGSGLGSGERPLRRWRERYEEEGADGLMIDRRLVGCRRGERRRTS